MKAKNSESKQIHRIFKARAEQENNGCIKCGSPLNLYYQTKSKRYLCNCLLNTFPLSGTPLHHSKVSINVWFDVIYDILNTPYGIDVQHIERKYKISNTAAWGLLVKLKDWIIMTEKKSNCLHNSRFVREMDGGRYRFFFRYNSTGIPPEQMENKMLKALPPLFSTSNVRGNA